MLWQLRRAFEIHVHGPQLIGGNLLLHEGLVRFVGVVALDHPVAIPPRRREEMIRFESRRVGVAHEIEPIPAPSFAVSRRGKKTVDEFFVGVGRLIVYELIHLLRRGRQAMQIEIRTTRQRTPVTCG